VLGGVNDPTATQNKIHTMKPATLKSALETYLNLRAEIGELEDLKIRSATELAELEAGCDLKDKAALQEIARLQVLARLFPARIAARDNQLETARAALVRAGSEFITETLRPKLNALREAAKEKVKIAVAGIYSDKDALDSAIAKSDLVRSVEAIGWNLTIQSNPPNSIDYVQTILQVWERATEIEKTL